VSFLSATKIQKTVLTTNWIWCLISMCNDISPPKWPRKFFSTHMCCQLSISSAVGFVQLWLIVSNLLEKYLKQNVRMVDGIKIAYTLHTRTTQCNEQWRRKKHQLYTMHYSLQLSRELYESYTCMWIEDTTFLCFYHAIFRHFPHPKLAIWVLLRLVMKHDIVINFLRSLRQTYLHLSPQHFIEELGKKRFTIGYINTYADIFIFYHLCPDNFTQHLQEKIE
jgi:hypothetical protein